MKNIIFDFGNVLLKMGTFQKLIETLDCVSNPEEFCKNNEKLIIDAHKDNSIDFFEIIQQHSGKKNLSKQQMLDILCSYQNDTLLQQLPELSKKYKLYILSDIMKDFIPYFLKKHGVEQYFSGVVESCNTGFLKPEDEIYNYLLSEYKLEPNESVFFDDRQKNIDAAKKNGIHAILYDDFGMDIEEKIKSLDL